MRSFSKVFALSLLTVAFLAVSAQARTVKGCVIKAKTSCVGKNLSGQNLRGVNFSSANLNGVNLSKADLRGANLKGANLREANLHGAKLGPKPTAKKNGAHASQTPSCAPNCQGANLSYANLTYANLTNANLYHANLSYANLSGAFLNDATLNNANLTGVALNFFSVVGATGCSTVTPTGALNGYINGNGCYN